MCSSFAASQSAMLNVVLVNPEIPPNTGNIGRLCCAVGVPLHLIRPLGFKIDDRSLKRAGLDYWKHVDLRVWDSLESYLASVQAEQVVLTSSKRGQIYIKVPFRPDDHILFGPETTGLSEEMFQRFPARIARVPILQGAVRSLNLATCAGIVVYEALRQIGGLPAHP